MTAPAPAVARWYQGVFSFVRADVADAAQAQRVYSTAFVIGQLAEYWQGGLSATVEAITGASRVGRTSTYDVLKALERAGLLVTLDRSGRNGAVRRALAIQGRTYTVRPEDLTGDDRTAPSGSGGDVRTVPDAGRTAGVRTEDGSSVVPSEGSQPPSPPRAACAECGAHAGHKIDCSAAFACPSCGRAPCLPQCRAARYSPKHATSEPPREALKDLRRRLADRRAS